MNIMYYLYNFMWNSSIWKKQKYLSRFKEWGKLKKRKKGFCHENEFDEHKEKGQTYVLVKITCFLISKSVIYLFPLVMLSVLEDKCKQRIK